MLWKSILLFLASASASVISTAVFRSVVNGRLTWRGTVAGLIVDLLSLLKQPLFYSGVAAFAVANILWILVIATQPMSIAVPVQIGLIIVLNTTISVAVFSEKLSAWGVAGLCFVLLGVMMLSIETHHGK